ncbi:uncharacterized protein Pyn_14049 [Prunus yedoensis var. nudiflora]|uniref:DUF1664 domain-containing protein n=1 Tax=Prunus yedoensis var. nudiflora TaxID=2094558 RepID=A0A314Z3P9_PRUYE|nr:uncharacterized protein Pyn_14049 [Prunus yedoensis var. nudiflora]
MPVGPLHDGHVIDCSRPNVLIGILALSCLRLVNYLTSSVNFRCAVWQLKGNDSQIGLTSLIMPAATLGALVYGYMWWKSVTEAIANTNNHLTQRVQNLDDQLLEQKEISKSILENVGDTKGSIEELYVTVTELQSALTGLDYKLGSISEKQGLKEIAESLSGTLTKSTDAIVQDDIEGPGMKPRNLLRSVSTKC